MGHHLKRRGGRGGERTRSSAGLESASQGHADQRTAMHSVPAAGQAAGQRVPSISRGQVSQIVDARNSWHVMSSNKVKEHCCARTTSRHSRMRRLQTLHDGLSPQPDISAWHLSSPLQPVSCEGHLPAFFLFEMITVYSPKRPKTPLR